MNTIRVAVAAEAVAATAVVVAGKVALEGTVVRAHLDIINNPVKALAAGFSAGLAKSTPISGTTGAPKPILPSTSMASGYRAGENVDSIVKILMKVYGSP